MWICAETLPCHSLRSMVKAMSHGGRGSFSPAAPNQPYNRPAAVVDGIAIAVGILAIAFHIALLKVSGKAVHVLIVRKDGFCL